MATKNMTTRFQGEKLIIEIDVSTDTIANAAPTKSGKSKMIASSGGLNHTIDLPSGLKMKLSLNATISTSEA